MLLSVWQWSCQYLFLRLRFVAAKIRTPNVIFPCQHKWKRLQKMELYSSPVLFVQRNFATSFQYIFPQVVFVWVTQEIKQATQSIY